jgi:hypothetical protein
MAIFKPEVKSAPVSFLGVIEVGILNFADKSDMFDWADIFIEVELSVKNSEYSNRMTVCGRLDKDAEGKITGGSVLKRMYNLFDILNCKAGLTIDSKWEDEEGEEINDIAAYLNNRFKTEKEDFVAYAYKKKPKKVGDKVYTEVYPKLYLNTPGGTAQCEKDIAWLKGKGYIKEADASDMPQKNDTPLADSALNNL